MNNRKVIQSLTLALVIGVLVVGAVAAQNGTGYDLTWWTVDGGGASVTGGSYTLNSTIGQHDASNPLTGGNYSLIGGFWGAGNGQNYKVNIPLVIK